MRSQAESKRSERLQKKSFRKSREKGKINKLKKNLYNVSLAIFTAQI